MRTAFDARKGKSEAWLAWSRRLLAVCEKLMAVAFRREPDLLLLFGSESNYIDRLFVREGLMQKELEPKSVKTYVDWKPGHIRFYAK